MMKLGLQYVAGMDIAAVRRNGINHIEICYEDRDQIIKLQNTNLDIKGIVIHLYALSRELFLDVLQFTKEIGAEYIIIDTRAPKLENHAEMTEKLENIAALCSQYIEQADIQVLIENSYDEYKNGFCYNDYSEAWKLCAVCHRCNELCGADKFGICINVGYANLLGTNIKEILSACKEYLKAVHVNDNNGMENQQQMPYTFTVGRGINATDWESIVNELKKICFDGWYIFDTIGTFKRTPVKLHYAMCGLIKGIAQEWEKSER